MSKSCFFVTPIGADNSDERRRADILEDLLLRPVLSDHYQIVRADKITEPGSVTSDMFKHLQESDLVIADLTDLNPNVFYELGVRHSFNKLTIQLIDTNQELPFDVRTERTIRYSIDSVEIFEQAKKALISYIDKSQNLKYSSPVFRNINISANIHGDTDVNKNIGNILKILDNIQSDISSLETDLLLLDNTSDSDDLAREVRDLVVKTDMLLERVKKSE